MSRLTRDWSSDGDGHASITCVKLSVTLSDIKFQSRDMSVILYLSVCLSFTDILLALKHEQFISGRILECLEAVAIDGNHQTLVTLRVPS